MTRTMEQELKQRNSSFHNREIA